MLIIWSRFGKLWYLHTRTNPKNILPKISLFIYIIYHIFIHLQERPPPVPPSRPYTVSGNKKIAFPQSRVMGQSFSGNCHFYLHINEFQYFLLQNTLVLIIPPYQLNSFSDEGTSSDVVLMKGETVIVIGNSPRRGYLIVEKRNHTIHVPYTLLALK